MENTAQPSLAKRVLLTLAYLGITFSLMFAGELIGSTVMLPLTRSKNEILVFLGKYASFIGYWIVFIGFAFIFKVQRPFLYGLSRREKGNRVHTALLIGLPLGIGLNLLAGVTALLHKDISLSYAGFDPWMLLVFILGVFIQSSAEELITRGFIFENVKRYFPNTPIVPILVNSMFFMVLHLANDGISFLPLLNLLLAGILYSLLVWYFHSIWAAMIAHMSWNFCQNILLGLPNSGIASAFSVFAYDASAASNSFAYDTAFGIEGSILCSALLAAACVLLWLIGRRRQAKNA